MNQPRKRKRLRTGIALGGAAALLLAFAALRLADIRAVYAGHVIATLELDGLASDDEAGTLREELAGEAGVRTVELAHRPGDPKTWLARVQFHARSADEARARIRRWMDSLGDGRSATLVRATRYRLRIARPSRGDVVIGPAEDVALRR